MKFRNLTVGVLSLGLAGVALAAEDDATSKRKRDELQARQAEVSKQISDVRREVEKTESIAALKKAADDARAKYEAKVAGSAKVGAAKKEVDAAQAAMKGAAEAEV